MPANDGTPDDWYLLLSGSGKNTMPTGSACPILPIKPRRQCMLPACNAATLKPSAADSGQVRTFSPRLKEPSAADRCNRRESVFNAKRQGGISSALPFSI